MEQDKSIPRTGNFSTFRNFFPGVKPPDLMAECEMQSGSGFGFWHALRYTLIGFS